MEAVAEKGKTKAKGMEERMMERWRGEVQLEFVLSGLWCACGLFMHEVSLEREIHCRMMDRVHAV